MSASESNIDSVTNTTSSGNLTQNPSSQQSTTSFSSSQPQPTQQECAHCSKTSSETPLKPCNKCHSVSYCSRDCQKADMKKHKKICAAAAQIYAQTADFKPQVTRVVPDEGRRRGLQKWQFDT